MPGTVSGSLLTPANSLSRSSTRSAEPLPIRSPQKPDWPLTGTRHRTGIAAVPALGLGGGLFPHCVVEQALAVTAGLRLHSGCADSVNRWFADLLKAFGHPASGITIRGLEQPSQCARATTGPATSVGA